MPEVVSDPLLPSCYHLHLFSGPGIQEYQQLVLILCRLVRATREGVS